MLKNGKVTHVNIFMYIFTFEACRVPDRKLLLPPDVICLFFFKKVNCCYFKGSHCYCYSPINEPLVVLNFLHSAPGLILLLYAMSVAQFSG